MVNKLHIEFLGLCGIVPNGQKRNSGYGSYDIIMPDILKPMESSGLLDHQEILPRGIEKHFPAIIVPNKLIANDFPKREAAYFNDEIGLNKRDYSIFLLDNESLKIEGLLDTDLSSKFTKVDRTNSNTHAPIDEHEQRELRWVPSLGLANEVHQRGVGEFDREAYLNADNTPFLGNKLKLATHLEINSGELYVGNVVRDMAGRPIRFPFAVTGKGRTHEWEQALYSKLIWEAESESDQFNLTVKKQGKDIEPLVTVNKDMYEPCTTIWLVNLEKGPLLSSGLFKASCDNEIVKISMKRMKPDYDFAVLYLYSKNIEKLEQGLPVAHMDKKLKRGFAGGRLNCRSGTYTG